MAEIIPAYPLQWPTGWKRTTGMKADGRFTSNKRDLSINDGVMRVRQQLEMMGVNANDVVISTNVPLRLDGFPRSDQAQPPDRGAAVYWRRGKDTRCIAIDHYTWVQDNLAAIAATLEAMRAIKRHGGAEILDRAFTGFTALPSPEQWFQVLGVSATATAIEIDQAYRRKAMEHHPDRPGGSADKMARINQARDDGLMQARS